jgi:apolipoprotein N-acyltransferase
MLQVILKKFDAYYTGANRFWIPPVCGLLYSLCLPPFNDMLHTVFAPMPLLSFAALIPLFYFVTREPRRRALTHTYLYCAAMTLGQYYWIGFVTAEGYWALILMGVVLISLAWGALYFVAALAFRYTARHLPPRLRVLIYPAAWVLVEYFRTMTDLAFPWSYLGYGTAGILPLAQLASVTGVWGLSYLAVAGNVALWELLRAYKSGGSAREQWLNTGAWATLTLAILVWGTVRTSARPPAPAAPASKIAIIQSYMDQFHWGRGSLDTAVTVSDSMVRVVARDKPDITVFSESALMCFLDRRPDIKQWVFAWAKNTGAPIIAGALHWELPQNATKTDKDVYNTVFLTDADNDSLLRYNKILLVPFSEIMPFEAKFPILSRVNLGGASFKRGDSESVFRINENMEIAPYICYEIIFPNFVRRRLKETTNLLVNVTNDGWFGRSSGPYQHATMARLRSIENGITLARSANSGISMFVDPYGRIPARTRLYTRDIIVREVPLYRVNTLYSRHGDWFVWLCAGLVVLGGGWRAVSKLSGIRKPV